MEKPTLILFEDGNSCQPENLDDHFHLLYIQDESLIPKTIRKNSVDLLIIAASPVQKEILVLKKIRDQFPFLSIVYHAENPSSHLILKAFRSGANDFINGDICFKSISECLSRIQESNQLVNSSSGRKNGKGIFKRWKAFVPRFFSLKKTLNGFINTSIEVQNKKRETAFYSVPMARPWPQPVNSISPDWEAEFQGDHISITLLGDFCVTLNGKRVDLFLNKKNKRLLAYLLFNHKKYLCKDRLMDIFWPNTLHESAKNSLHVAIHNIRKAFQKIKTSQPILQYQDECYFFHPEVSITSDASEFIDLWELGRSKEHHNGLADAIPIYKDAVDHYGGDLMENQLYESWCEEDRENLKEIYLVMLERLCDYYEGLNSWYEVEKYGNQILEKDICRENIHRTLMRCFQHQGQRIKAMKQFQACVKALLNELETSPTNVTVELFEKIKGDTYS